MKSFLLLLSILMMVSCSPKDSEGDENPTDEEIANAYCLTYECPTGPPNIISYPANNISLTINENMPTISPIVEKNYSSVVFRTSLDLPQGLTFNKETGEISGTVTALYEKRTINVIVDNRILSSQTGGVIAGGIDTYPLTFEVVDLPPQSLELVNEEEYDFYKSSNDEENRPNQISSLELERGESIDPLVFKFNSGGEIVSYSVIPSLPEGLFFNGERLFGRPLISQQTRNYSFKFVNSGGEQSISLSIKVKGKAPSNLTYLKNNPIYRSGLDIVNNNPIYEGDPAENFSVEPALPLGLLLNSQTGKITGIPEEIVTNKEYKVIASNEWGETNTNIRITINPFISDIETGDDFSCAIKNKIVYCWGLNNLNQLGYISEDTCIDSTTCSKTANKVVNSFDNSNLKSLMLSSSKATTCSLNENKTIDCWGDNSFGQLGNSDQVLNTIDPVKVKLGESILGDIKKIYSGNLFHCALDNLNNLYCWGDNSYKQIKNSSNEKLYKAELIASNIEDISLGFNKLCYKKDSKYLCRGRNLNNTISSSSDEIIEDLTTIKNSDDFDILDIEKLILGENFSYYFKVNQVFSWGLNNFGQLYNSNISQSDYPLLVDDSTKFNIESKYSLSQNSYCLYIDNNIKCLGYNNNTFFSNESVGGSVSEFTAYEVLNLFEISSKSYKHRCYSVNSRVYCGGDNFYGNLGDNTLDNSTLPKEVIFE